MDRNKIEEVKTKLKIFSSIYTSLLLFRTCV